MHTRQLDEVPKAENDEEVASQLQDAIRAFQR